MTRKNILITGASSGLGEGMARLFAGMDRNLALCARRLDRLENLQTELQGKHPGIKVLVRQLDVNDHDLVFKAFAAFDEELGGLDRVIVNAGMGKGASLGTGYFYANVQTAMTNFVAALAQCEAAMQIFRSNNAGHLVTISSVSAVRGFRGPMNVYAATKAGLSSLSEGLRADVRGTPIRISSIHPGFIRSELNEKVKDTPFIVDTETGCRAMVKAIEKEPAKAFVPFWPWAILRVIYPLIPPHWF